MTISKNGVVYCDANFLIAYGAKATKQPELQRQAQALFARLLISQCKICVSALTFDEAWNGIRKELGPKKVSNSIRYKLNKFIDKFGLRLANYGASEFSYREIFNDLHSFTAKFLNSNKIEVIQFNNLVSGIKNALDNLKSFSLKPRDSFHLAIMKDRGATHFISNDKDFQKVQSRIKSEIGVEILNF
ncbi:type II toxin-antitoxin system VapC family toxin [Candidatus Wolfebacteria bacterium]|nr:type II toxin-antitoxin system VapC family toxin [Candidatus Wolfebacteria bacterium]